MSTIFSAGHNSNNWSEYTSTALNGGNLSLSSGAALAGTAYGISSAITNTNQQYAYYLLAATDSSTSFEGRFYIDPNTMSISDGGQISVFYLVNSTTTETFVVYKLMNIGGSFVMRGVLINDAGTHNETSAFTISDAPHYIEFKATKAGTSSSSDSTLDTWVDGSAQTQLTGVDCYDRFNTRLIVFGAPSQSGTISGTFYLDELVVNNTGTYIGPLANSYTLTAAQGSFSLTGQATGLKVARKVTATQNSYTLTGNAATLRHGYSLTAGTGTFALTGNTTGLLVNRKIISVSSSFTLTGNSTRLITSRYLVAAYGSFSQTGSAAGLFFGRNVIAAYGSFTLTGNNTALTVHRNITANHGTFTQTGIDAAVRAGRKISAVYASYSLTGYDATLTSSHAGGYTIAAEMGSFALSGNATRVLASRLIPAVYGTFTETGMNAGVYVGRKVIGTYQTYSLTGNATSFLHGYYISSSYGAYTVTGNSAAIIRSARLSSVFGSFLLTGYPVTLTQQGATIVGDAYLSDSTRYAAVITNRTRYAAVISDVEST